MILSVSMIWATSISQGHRVVHVSQVAQSHIALEVRIVSFCPACRRRMTMLTG